MFTITSVVGFAHQFSRTTRRQPLQEELAPSEALVLSIIDELGKADVYEIVDRVNRSRDKDWKFQTVNTLCLRLEGKGYLQRAKAGRRVVYSPKITRNTFFEKLIGKFFGSSLKRDPGPLISYLAKNEHLDDQDKKLLSDLMDKLKDKE